MLLFSIINFFVLFKIVYFLNRFLQAVIVGFGITSKHSCVSETCVGGMRVSGGGLCGTLGFRFSATQEGQIQLR